MSKTRKCPTLDTALPADWCVNSAESAQSTAPALFQMAVYQPPSTLTIPHRGTKLGYRQTHCDSQLELTTLCSRIPLTLSHHDFRFRSILLSLPIFLGPEEWAVERNPDFKERQYVPGSLRRNTSTTRSAVITLRFRADGVVLQESLALSTLLRRDTNGQRKPALSRRTGYLGT